MIVSGQWIIMQAKLTVKHDCSGEATTIPRLKEEDGLIYWGNIPAVK